MSMKDEYSGRTRFEEMLPGVQNYLSVRYADLLSADTDDRQARICSHIEKYLISENLPAKEEDLPGIVRRLYLEVAEYSFLTDYLNDEEVEEIDINRWDDVKVTYADGLLQAERHKPVVDGRATGRVDRREHRVPRPGRFLGRHGLPALRLSHDDHVRVERQGIFQ
jgi:pilus assembly protein CpaF